MKYRQSFDIVYGDEKERSVTPAVYQELDKTNGSN